MSRNSNRRSSQPRWRRLPALLRPSRLLRPAWLVGRPDVLVDFECEDGWLFVAVTNHGSTPAHDVSVWFDPPFYGVDDERAVPEQNLFSDLSFLPPGKSIRTFVDFSEAYFERGEPTAIHTEVRFRDRYGRPFGNEARHDLSIYEDLVWSNRTSSTSHPPGDFDTMSGR